MTHIPITNENSHIVFQTFTIQLTNELAEHIIDVNTNVHTLVDHNGCVICTYFGHCFTDVRGSQVALIHQQPSGWYCYAHGPHLLEDASDEMSAVHIAANYLITTGAITW